MGRHQDNLERIQVIADGLDGLLEETIFIGGICTGFYMEHPDQNEIRMTGDVDCIVKIHSYAEFETYNEKLRTLGFKHDISEDAPMVRWIYKGEKVDVIPDTATIAGYRDIPWFTEGREHTETRMVFPAREPAVPEQAAVKGTKLGLSRDQVDVIRNCLEDSTLVDLMAITGRSNRTKFRDQVLNPLIKSGLLVMTIPEKPKSRLQKYRLTSNGKKWVEKQVKD